MSVIRALAQCTNCEWEIEARNAVPLAAKHYYKTGHEVHVEVTYVVIYPNPTQRALATTNKEGVDGN